MNYFEGSALFDGIAETSARMASVNGPARGSQTDYRDIPVHDVLPQLAPNHHRALDSAAADLGQRILSALEERKQRMHTLDERKGLFDI
jgi:hypothetical protein